MKFTLEILEVELGTFRHPIEVGEPRVTQSSRASSGGVIKRYYEDWRNSLPSGIGAPLDQKRLFDKAAKNTIWTRECGNCAVCGEGVNHEDAEYDHFPIAYRDGGPTSLDNGRLAHNNCHPRGRPVEI